MTLKNGFRATCAAALLTCAAAGSAPANDSFAGISAGGLVFEETEAITMASEDLFISRDEIRVKYVFRNTTNEDVSGIVAFPLPPLDLFTEMYGDFPFDAEELTETNFTKFSVSVNGKTVKPQTQLRAILAPSNEAAASDYVEGTDVTEILEAHNIPLSFDNEAIAAAFQALPEEARQDLMDQGLFSHPGGEMYEPRWRIAITYSWSQTFKAGAETRIEHRYQPINAAWFFEMNDEARAKFCVDAGTEKAIDALSAAQMKEYPDMGSLLVATGVRYILTTAESWKGPIGHFKLTIDKGSPKSVVSLCIGEIEKTGPTSFVFEKDDYVPERDLVILMVDRPDMAQ